MTCTATETLLEWDLKIVGITNSIPRIISATATSLEIRVPLDSSTLIFSRVSDLGTSPLISTLVVPAVNQGLNGTRITCIDRRADVDTRTMATTTVYIIYDGRAWLKVTGDCSSTHGHSP